MSVLFQDYPRFGYEKQACAVTLFLVDSSSESVELERDLEALLESYAQRTPDALNTLTAEERHQV